MRLTPEREKEIRSLKRPYTDELLAEIDALREENLLMKITLEVCKNAFPLTNAIKEK